MQRVIFAVIAVLAVLLIGGIYLYGRRTPPPPPETAIENPTPTLKAHVVLGNPDAPHTVVEFSNYRCPHCQNHALNMLGVLVSNYVERGRVRYVLRHLPFSRQPDVFAASVAAGCVYDQAPDRFLDYHLLLFRAVEDWAGRSGAELEERLLDYARQLSLDAEALSRCLASEEARERVRFDQELALALGVEGTPTFFVDGEKRVGVLPLAEWRELLER